MKRVFTAILLLTLAFLTLSGCAGGAQETVTADDRIRVVCTIFPQYDWAREILGGRADGVELTLLTDGGVDLHSYQPSTRDIVTLSTADLFLSVGGESDAWVGDALAGAKNPNMTVIRLTDALGAGVKAEELIEGMEEEPEEEEAALDEHVWLSLQNAECIASAIADAICELDGGHAEEYRANLDSYTEKLRALDARYQSVVDAAPVKTLLFGDRFPFRYLVDDYGLGYYAAFPGCSAETEASFETIIFLANKVSELELRNVMVTESSDQSVAKTIIESAGDDTRGILTLDAMQSVTREDAESGTTYLAVMEENLSVLKDALV